MYPAQTLSEQQVLTLYIIGTFLTLYPIVLGFAALLGFMHRKARTEG